MPVGNGESSAIGFIRRAVIPFLCVIESMSTQGCKRGASALHFCVSGKVSNVVHAIRPERSFVI